MFRENIFSFMNSSRILWTTDDPTIIWQGARLMYVFLSCLLPFTHNYPMSSKKGLLKTQKSWRGHDNDDDRVQGRRNVWKFRGASSNLKHLEGEYFSSIPAKIWRGDQALALYGSDGTGMWRIYDHAHMAYLWFFKLQLIIIILHKWYITMVKDRN